MVLQERQTRQRGSGATPSGTATSSSSFASSSSSASSTDRGRRRAGGAPSTVPAGRLALANLFIAVGTPPDEDGSADLKYVLAVAAEIGRLMSSDKIIVTKSTVPVGTSDKVRAAAQAAFVIDADGDGHGWRS